MHKKVFVLLLMMLPSIAVAQGTKAPYKGFEKREIKALSSARVHGYLKGKGMGQGLAAEMNHYPGPLHILELSAELGLNKSRALKALDLRYEVYKEATKLGNQIVDKERALDKLFAEQKINNESLEKLIMEIAELKGRLRMVHLRAHLEMKSLLTKEQIDKYGELRGYEGNGESIHFQPCKKHGL